MPPVPPTRSGLQVVDTTGHADTATLTVSFKTSVAITGDFHAVEGTADTISLTFVRTTNDTSQYLDVIYDVNYVAVNGPAASPSDLVNPNDLTGTIRITAGQTASAPIVLTAKADNVGDGIENLQVVIQPTSDYVPVSRPTTLTKNNNVEGVAFATLQILDGVTPSRRTIRLLREMTTGRFHRQTLASPSTTLTRVLLATATSWRPWRLLRRRTGVRSFSLITDNQNGSYNVKLYDAGNPQRETSRMGLDPYQRQHPLPRKRNGPTVGRHRRPGWQGRSWPMLLEKRGTQASEVRITRSEETRAALGRSSRAAACGDPGGGTIGHFSTEFRSSWRTTRASRSLSAPTTTPGSRIFSDSSGLHVPGDHSYVGEGLIDSDHDGVIDEIDLFNPWGHDGIQATSWRLR